MSEKLLGKPLIKVLVYGWYHKGNIGDDLFAEAFRHLFPEFIFTFTDRIDLHQVKNCDAVFFGGGSFLYGRPIISDEALNLLKTKKIFYIGVGVEPEINPLHQELMALAQVVAIRSPEELERVRKINPNTWVIPDLVFALQDKVELSPKKKKSILVLPNILVVPQSSDPYWKHSSWQYFKNQFCQALDVLVEDKYHLNFLPFGTSHKLDDSWAAAELVAHMDRRSRRFMLEPLPPKIKEITQLMSQYEVIITQRFHGIVLAEMVGVPYLSIHHHDKLKNFQSTNGKFLSYYNTSKHEVLARFQEAREIKKSDILPIETNIFEDLKQHVISLIK